MKNFSYLICYERATNTSILSEQIDCNVAVFSANANITLIDTFDAKDQEHHFWDNNDGLVLYQRMTNAFFDKLIIKVGYAFGTYVEVVWKDGALLATLESPHALNMFQLTDIVKELRNAKPGAFTVTAYGACVKVSGPNAQEKLNKIIKLVELSGKESEAHEKIERAKKDLSKVRADIDRLLGRCCLATDTRK